MGAGRRRPAGGAGRHQRRRCHLGCRRLLRHPGHRGVPAVRGRRRRADPRGRRRAGAGPRPARRRADRPGRARPEGPARAGHHLRGVVEPAAPSTRARRCRSRRRCEPTASSVSPGGTAELGRLVEHWSAATGGRAALRPHRRRTRHRQDEAGRRAGQPGARRKAPPCCTDGATQDMGFSYQPFVDPLQHFARHTAHSVLAGQLGPHGGDLVRLCPDLAARARPAAAAAARIPRPSGTGCSRRWPAGCEPSPITQPARPGARRPARGRAARRCCCCATSLRATEAARLLVLATYRDTELGRTHPLAETLAELRRIPGVERLSLGGSGRARARVRCSTSPPRTR